MRLRATFEAGGRTRTNGTPDRALFRCSCQGSPDDLFKTAR
jgi:hypothetical protein